MLPGAGVFGYMLVLLQLRLFTIVSSNNDQGLTKTNIRPSSCQNPLKSVRQPLIPTGDEQDQQEEGFFGSFGKLLQNAWACIVEIMGGIFPGFRRKKFNY